MLGDFFRINMPYGIARNEEGGWYAFNREYVPIGFNKSSVPFDEMNLPIYTKYQRITEDRLFKIAWDGSKGIHRNERGEIVKVWLYNDATNPMHDSKQWPAYFSKIKLLSKFTEAE